MGVWEWIKEPDFRVGLCGKLRSEPHRAKGGRGGLKLAGMS